MALAPPNAQSRQVTLKQPVRPVEGCTVDQLGAGQWPQRQYLHAPRRGIGNAGQQQHIGRTGEQKASGLAAAVHSGFDGKKKFRRTLDFVQSNRAGQSTDKAGWIRFGSIQHHRVVQRQVLAQRQH